MLCKVNEHSLEIYFHKFSKLSFAKVGHFIEPPPVGRNAKKEQISFYISLKKNKICFDPQRANFWNKAGDLDARTQRTSILFGLKTVWPD
jgi:hypothetical protein